MCASNNQNYFSLFNQVPGLYDVDIVSASFNLSIQNVVMCAELCEMIPILITQFFQVMMPQFDLLRCYSKHYTILSNDRILSSLNFEMFILHDKWDENDGSLDVPSLESESLLKKDVQLTFFFRFLKLKNVLLS